jgi:hypothetical protein
MTPIMRTSACAILAACLLSQPLQAENAVSGNLAVTQAWSRATTLGNSEGGVAPVTADAERVSNDQWRVKMLAPVPGRWSLRLGITISATDQVNVVSPILIR